MARKTRRHPNRVRALRVGPPLRKVEHGCYETADGIRIENRNAGRRDAWWVAVDASKRTVAMASTLGEVRRKLAKVMAPA
jgi:hypothetical protein